MINLSLEWNTYSIGESCELITGFPFKSKNYLEDGTYNVVRGDNVKEGFIKWDDKKRCWNELDDKVKKVILKEKDIVIGMDGSKLGKNRATISKKDLPALLAQRVACVRAKEGFDQNYINYVILSNNFKLYVDKVKTGTSIPHISLGQISEFTFEAPNYNEQINISEILLNIDKKIQINQEINKNLTNIVLLLFKNWFVDFNFLNENNKPYKNDNGELKDSILGLIPKDWNVDSLGKYVEIDRGFSYKGKYLSEEGIPLINLGNILPNSEFRLEKLKFYSGEFDKKYKVNVGDILVANTDLTQNRLVLGSPIIVPSLIDEEDIIYSHHINRLSNFKLPKFYIFYNLLSERYNHMVSGYATGTTVLAISKESITNYKILIPPEELILKFDELAKNIEKIKDNNLIEMEKLTKLRNILLPKLMSGEIDVSQLDYLNNSIER